MSNLSANPRRGGVSSPRGPYGLRRGVDRRLLGAARFGQLVRPRDHPRHRPGVHLLVIAARDQPFRLLELFPQNYHEPYYMSYTNEDFSALRISSGLTHIRDVKVFVSKVMVFDKPASRAPAVADAEK
jgi:hypothetical protein